ncbi:MAG: helix-turn-helix transcriptional regulator [Candidatus Izemoplasma sp.]
MRNISFSDYLVDYLELEGISQQEFAHSLDINQSQLSLILNKKRLLSYKLMVSISMVTPFKIDEIVKIETNHNIEKNILNEISKNNDTISNYIKRYNYKKLEEYDSTISFKNIEDKLEVVKDIMKYLRISKPYINKLSTVKFKSNHNKVELVNIWLEKCYRETKKQEISEYKKDNIDIVVKKINVFAIENSFDLKEIVKLFNTNGIYLSIVADMIGSKIRGAFRVIDDKPAIYLTLKHKRPADIFFALLHELAHCKTDFNSGKNKTYISLEESMITKIDDSENLADKKAFNWMIEDKVFEKIRILDKKLNLVKIAKEYNVALMFLVYRLAESGDLRYNNPIYQKYNPVLIF